MAKADLYRYSLKCGIRQVVPLEWFGYYRPLKKLGIRLQRAALETASSVENAMKSSTMNSLSGVVLPSLGDGGHTARAASHLGLTFVPRAARFGSSV